MTVRLYYDDSALTCFDAVVEACTPAGDGVFDVRLDRTAFYPTSGGQPFDTGTLGGRRIVDVVDRGEEGIAHLVDGALEPGARTRGEIDVARRRDHREQHTGQHVLSAALVGTIGAATVGFHLGTDVSTIDLDRIVNTAEIQAGEEEANRIVREDRPVTIRYAEAEDAAALGLRRPSGRTGPLRIVEIEGFDRSACGGTHVVRTGEVGLIGVVGSEKVRGGTRLQFVCGARADRAFRTSRDRLSEIAVLLGVAPADIATHVRRLAETKGELERTAAAMHEELATLRAAAWRDAAERIGDWRVVVRQVEEDAAALLKVIAQAVVSEPGCVAVVIGRGSPVPVVVARAGDVGLDAGAVVKTLAGAVGGRGGGRPELAQGGMNGDPARIASVATAELRRMAGEVAIG